MALFLRWILVFSLALFPIASHALALGKLKVLSALNEPLNAEIEFTSVTEKELKGFVASLAARADFDEAGIERPPFLSQIKFMVAKRTDGHHYLQLRTDEQIDEPFLHFLLQVEWPGGKLVREYTALIDPPYKVMGKAAPVETPVIEAPKPAPAPEAQAAAPSASAPVPTPEAVPGVKPQEEIPPVAAAKPEELKTPEQTAPTTTEPPKEETKTESAPAPEAAAPEKPLGPPVSAEQTPSASTEESAAPKVEPLEAAPKIETAPEAAAPPPEVAAEEKPAPVPEAAPATVMSEYNVKKGDTVWVIADKTRAGNKDVSVEQVILAIYRTNKDAFFGNNVNNLKAGKILKLPEREEVNSVAGPQARREFRAQYNAWQEYKLKLAAASGAVKLTEAATPAPAVTETKPPVPDTAKKPAVKPAESVPPVAEKSRQDDLLKIVRNTLQKEKSTPDKNVAEKESAKESGANERQALADRAATLEESLESKRLENKELSEKIGLVRSQLKKESRLIELENQSLAQQKKPAETKPAETPVKPADKPAAVAPSPEKLAKPEEPMKVEPLAPAPKPAPAPTAAPKKRAALPPPPVQEEKGFLATLLEAIQSDLLVPVLIGVVVLVSGGIALIYFRRRQKSIAEFEESILSADAISTDQPATTGNVNSQQKQAVTTGGDTSFLSDFSQGGMGNIHTDEVDPIAEAEVYLAYGRDETAEDILKEAVVKNPDRQELKLKLLEIYHQRNDVSAFETLAEELYAALGGRGGKIWEKVEEMGRKLNPENPMFRGGAPAAGGAPKPKLQTTAARPATPTMDTQVNAPPPAAAPSSKTEIVGGVDFDTGMPSASGGNTDSFDIGGMEDTHAPAVEPKNAGKADSGLDSLDFGAPADSGLDFDIGAKDDLGGLDGAAPSAAAHNEIKWEPEGTPVAEAEAPAAGNGENSAQWDETATKLDLAKAYIDMGDAEGARSILQEVMAEGSDAQKKQAQELSTQIG
ncbi:MAG: hypothetical protein HY081_03010 [Gammaproteobacteria bacterium]|nr:hypothetical protein [Gammaproteobacteria bacterium]